MPYASVADVKVYLQIPSQVADYDSEISAIIEFVDGHVNAVLRRYFTAAELPLSNTHEDYPVVRWYEAMWAAGEFKQRREGRPQEQEHPYAAHAREGLTDYLEAKYTRVELI